MTTATDQRTVPPASGPSPRLPDFVRDRLPAIRATCRKYQVESLYLYGSAVTDDYVRGFSDLDFMVEFTSTARAVYDGPPEHYLRGARKDGSAYPVNYRALTAALAEVFDGYLSQAERRVPIDIGTYSCINNEYFKRVVDAQKIRLYGR